MQYLYDSDCKTCNLNRNAESVCIPSRGSDNPKILFVGEAPRYQDDKLNLIFSGVYSSDPSFKSDRISVGEQLAKLLDIVKIPLDICRFTTVCKCFPKSAQSKYKPPTKKELFKCSAFYLTNEILQYKPKYVVTFGEKVFSHLTKYRTMSRVRGLATEISFPSTEWYDLMKESGVEDADLPDPITINVFPTYHPAAVFHDNKTDIEVKLMGDLSYLHELIDGKDSLDQDKYKLLLDTDQVTEHIDYLIDLYKNGKISKIACDVETGGPASDDSEKSKGGLNPYNPENLLLTVSLTYKEGQAVIIPVEHPESPWCKDRIVLKFIISELSRLFTTVPTVGHNYKFDIVWMMKKGISIDKISGDTYLKSLVLHNDTLDHDLEYLASKFVKMLGHKKVIKDAQIKAGTNNLTLIPLNIVSFYNGLDTDATLRLDNYFDVELEKEGLSAVNDRLMTSAILPTVQLELNGHKLNLDGLESAGDSYQKEVDRIYNRLDEFGYIDHIKEKRLWKEANDKAKKLKTQKDPNYHYKNLKEKYKNDKVKLSSDDNKRVILYDLLKIDGITILGKDCKTKTGAYVTDKHALETYRDYYKEKLINETDEAYKKWYSHVVECIELFLSYSQVAILLSTFVKGLREKVDNNSILHPSYKIRGTTTGRYACKMPNLQQIPAKSLIKKSFISRYENGLILQADYAQVEMRVLAMITKDPNLMNVFSTGEDIHRSVAAEVLEKAVELVTDDERRQNKAVGFGILYGRGIKALALALNITEERAKELIDNFFNKFKCVRSWIDNNNKEVEEKEEVRTVFGHRRKIISSIHDTAAMHRRATNTKIQSVAADIFLESMIRMYYVLQRVNLKSKHVSCVHDSVSFDVYPGELIPLSNIIIKQMYQVPGIIYEWATVPLLVDLEIGTSWGSLCDLEVVGANTVKISGDEGNFRGVVRVIKKWGSKSPRIREIKQLKSHDGTGTIEGIFSFPQYIV